MALLHRSKSAFPLRLLAWFFRFIEFLACAMVLGIFAYFLAVLADHSLHIDTWLRAVTGISGFGVLYTLFALGLVCCLGGVTILSLIAIVLDLGFTGAWIYVVYETRGATDGCSKGSVRDTPIGRGVLGGDNTVDGGDGGFTVLPSLRTACRLQQVSFGVGIIAIVFFFFSVLIELALIRAHKSDKKWGPSPANNYTTGRVGGAGLLSRFRRNKNQDTIYPKSDPDALTATHPEPQMGYMPPTGTAVVDDTKDSRYGAPGPLPTAQPGYGPTAPVNGGYGNMGPDYANTVTSGGTHTMTTTTTTSTSPPTKTGYGDL